jgi:mRNA-degrading endonuclease RelE of RelBE toxin-antitoxin system
MQCAALADEPQGDYELVLTPPAQRALTERLPEAVAAAVINFLTTSLAREPRRVGKPLRGDLAGIWSARRGSYRVLYRLREDTRECQGRANRAPPRRLPSAMTRITGSIGRSRLLNASRPGGSMRRSPRTRWAAEARLAQRHGGHRSSRVGLAA